jgi:hypothetical protein
VVSAPITSAGTYAAFTTTENSGVEEGDKSMIGSMQISAVSTDAAAYIELALYQREEVSVAIYNGLGQKVAVIANEEIAPGKHRFVWNLSAVPSGIYYCRVHTASSTKTVKIAVHR